MPMALREKPTGRHHRRACSKEHINIRIDHDMLEWFKANGRGYQTLINNVLRAFAQSRRQRETTRSQ
jgi:uncharacterized protein (DUF4415 family)